MYVTIQVIQDTYNDDIQYRYGTYLHLHIHDLIVFLL